MRTVTFKITMRIPFSRIAWQLYDMPGADMAARKLHAALAESMQTGDWSFIHAEQKTQAKFGALDTEPRDIVFAYMDKIALLQDRTSKEM